MSKLFEQWAKPQLEKLQKILLLEDFYPLVLEKRLDNPNSTAQCKFTYPYKTIYVGYGDELVKIWRNQEYARVVSILAHEMCHPITDPLYAKATNQWRSKDEVEDERERLTDHIANIIIKNKLI